MKNKAIYNESKIEKKAIENLEYLKQLQKFYDIVDNVENEKLKMDIIVQMLKCNEILFNEMGI